MVHQFSTVRRVNGRELYPWYRKIPCDEVTSRYKAAGPIKSAKSIAKSEPHFTTLCTALLGAEYLIWAPVHILTDIGAKSRPVQR